MRTHTTFLQDTGFTVSFAKVTASHWGQVSACLEPLAMEEEQLILRGKSLASLQIDQCHFSNLRILSASHNALVDIAIVSQLKALVELNVNQNQITDLSPAFQCPLEVLLAAKNRISNIDGIQQLQRLRRLSLFENQLTELDLDILQACGSLESLDLGLGREIILHLPNLLELDGEAVTSMDRQLAQDFVDVVGARPCTAPTPRRSAPNAEAMQLRLQTISVECENVRKEIKRFELQEEEPILGSAALQKTLKKLEKENSSMHALAEKNRKMKEELEEKEVEIFEKRRSLGLPERPGSAMLEPTTAEGYRAKCRALKRDLETERERTLKLRAKICSRVLKKDVSPPREL